VIPIVRRRDTLVHLLVVVLVAITLLGTSGCFATEELTTRQILIDARRRRDLALPPTLTPTSTPTIPIPTATPTRTPNPGRTLANVRRVWDGNTILIEGGFTVRYIGVNTPGAGMFRRPVEPFGREAAERNIELVEGQQVELEEDAADVDPSGFMLRYVYVDGEMVNETLLREGLARFAPVGRNGRYANDLRAAEIEAREQPVNIWTIPTPTATNTPLPTPTRTPTATPPPAVTRNAGQARPTLVPTFTLRALPANTGVPPVSEPAVAATPAVLPTRTP
jgi:endonuclease YncB( thermonuclease family)